jgi:hypothetical protein
VNRLILGLLIVAQQVSPQCGSSSTASVQNMVPLAINAGPTGDAFNTAFATVNICPAGQTTGCQSVDGVMVDTGSTGLRILSSALNVSLTPQTTSTGARVVECFPFQDGFTWGAVANADVKLGTYQASNIPIQVIGGSQVPAPPDACTSGGMPSEDTLNDLGANGVLGIGLFRQDCGFGCTVGGSSNPNIYFGCNGSNCQPITQSLTVQLLNPVWTFSSDNNGTAIQIATVPANGQSQATGLLLFGIGTQSNNSLGSATVFTVDGSGNMTTKYGSTTVPGFIDSGSNGLYFLDSATTQIQACNSNKDFYCPSTTLNLSATNTSTTGRVNTVNFSIGNAETLLNQPFSLLPQVGGSFAGYFDWGMPFFFGRTVFTGIEGETTPGGTGPYFAY